MKSFVGCELGEGDRFRFDEADSLLELIRFSI